MPRLACPLSASPLANLWLRPAQGCLLLSRCSSIFDSFFTRSSSPTMVSLTLSGLRYILHTSSQLLNLRRCVLHPPWRHPIAFHSVTLTYLQTHTCLNFGTFSSSTSLFRLICALPKLEHLEFGESLGMSMSDSASHSAWKSSFGKSTRLRSHVVSYHGCKDAFRFDC